MTPSELLATQLAAVDPGFARQVAGTLAVYLLEWLQAGRRVAPLVRELVAALLRACSDSPEPVSSPKPPPDQGADSELLTIEQVAQALGCSVQYARRLASRGPAQGGLEAIRAGSVWITRRRHLDEYLERRRRRETMAEDVALASEQAPVAEPVAEEDPLMGSWAGFGVTAAVFEGPNLLRLEDPPGPQRRAGTRSTRPRV